MGGMSVGAGRGGRISPAHDAGAEWDWHTLLPGLEPGTPGARPCHGPDSADLFSCRAAGGCAPLGSEAVAVPDMIRFRDAKGSQPAPPASPSSGAASSQDTQRRVMVRDGTQLVEYVGQRPDAVTEAALARILDHPIPSWPAEVSAPDGWVGGGLLHSTVRIMGPYDPPAPPARAPARPLPGFRGAQCSAALISLPPRAMGQAPLRSTSSSHPTLRPPSLACVQGPAGPGALATPPQRARAGKAAASAPASSDRRPRSPPAQPGGDWMVGSLSLPPSAHVTPLVPEAARVKPAPRRVKPAPDRQPRLGLLQDSAEPVLCPTAAVQALGSGSPRQAAAAAQLLCDQVAAREAMPTAWRARRGRPDRLLRSTGEAGARVWATRRHGPGGGPEFAGARSGGWLEKVPAARRKVVVTWRAGSS